MGMSVQKKCICGFVLFTLLIGIFGFLIGFYARPRPDNQACNGAKNGDDASIWKSYEKEALAFVSAEQIRHYLMYFSNHSHLAGTNVSYAQAQYIEAEWKALGFDTVEMKRYDVLLSYPKRPSMVSLIDSSGTVVHLSVSTEHAPGVVFPYSAYSASGVVTGKLMYVNYGRESDFKYLDDININCSGKIVILRHGKIFSSQKAENAQRRGARGVILYPDPADYDYVRNETNHTYSEWFPNNTVQRRHVWTRNGDPLTPGYPATAGIYREPVDKVPLIKIPVQPISYKDAELLLRILNQTMAPTKWQGGLGFIYRIQMAANDTRNVSVNVSLVLETRPVYNVVATIVGGTEPDRYVLLGNPRDAWTFGAVNPSSGSAVMMEVARSLQAIRKKGWRPRRTIKLCSWGAKEFGVIGSGEWVEEYGKVLAARAVAYINVESAVEGTFAMKVKSSPLLVGAAFNVAKKVAVPSSSSESLYEEWKRKVTNGSEANPRVSSVFGESDCLFFAYNIGVPCIDLGYRRDNTSSAYPVQHSIHDTFHWLETFVDPTLAYHKALAQVWLQLTFDIAGSVLIPFDLNRYAEDIDAYSNELWEYYNDTLNNNNITLEFLLNSTKDFIVAAKEFKDFLNKLDKNNVLQVRMANDRLLQLNRAFIAKDGLLGRPSLRHVVLAPSIYNTEAGNKLPGISDSIYIARKSGKREDWEQVKKQVSVVVHAVRSAISVIRPVNS